MNQAKVAITDYAIKCHTLSEGYGFFLSLKYNSERKISQTDFNTIEANFKRNGKLSVAHLTAIEINTMIDKISQIYGLDAVKANL